MARSAAMQTALDNLKTAFVDIRDNGALTNIEKMEIFLIAYNRLGRVRNNIKELEVNRTNAQINADNSSTIDSINDPEDP